MQADYGKDEYGRREGEDDRGEQHGIGNPKA
jgi:hypothetical protein